MPSLAISETWRARPADLDAEAFFDLLDHRPFALLHGNGRYLILGQEPLDVLLGDTWPAMAWERQGDLPPILPDLVGLVGYEHGYTLEPLAGTPAPGLFPFPTLHLSLYRHMRILDRATGLLYDGERRGWQGWDGHPHGLVPGAFSARKVLDTETPDTYATKVRRIRAEIAAGNVYQVNLTRQEGWSIQGDLRTFARRLHRENPAPFSAFLAAPDFTVVSSSPERLLHVEGGVIDTRPIKGTAPRSADAREDARLAQDLFASAKNRSELAMIVDLMRNDLAQVCNLPGVEVPAFPQLETYANVHHLVATVRGTLRAGLSFHDLLCALFPGGSVTGCPKLAAMGLIRELEPLPRQVYTGALGWLRHDLAQMDLALPIRTAFAVGQTLLFGVGGGVVWDSDPDDEYVETLHKGRSLVRCLS